MRQIACLLLALGAVLFGIDLDRLALHHAGAWFLLVWLVVSAAGKMHVVLGGRPCNMGTAFSSLFVLVIIGATIAMPDAAGTEPGHLSGLVMLNLGLWGAWVAFDVLSWIFPPPK